jgi:hypothetical protein
MEYLVTYGWAILVVAVIVVVLYSFGVFTRTQPQNECLFSSEFGCLNSEMYADGGLVINMQQATATRINITAIGCNTNDTTNHMISLHPPVTLDVNGNISIGGNATTALHCYSNGTIYTTQSSSVFHGYVIINYTNLQTDVQHTVVGQVTEDIFKANTPYTTSTTVTTTSSTTSTSVSSTSSTSTSTSSTSTIQQTFNPTSGTYTGDVVFSSATTLTSSVLASNSIFIESGVTVTTNGASLVAGKVFSNAGTIQGGSYGSAMAFTSSWAGSGGGSGGYGGGSSNCGSTSGVAGYATLVPGGTGGSAGGGSGGSGSTPSTPSSTAVSANLSAFGSNILADIQTLLSSGGSGEGASASVYGVYIQAKSIIPGTIFITGISQSGNSGQAGSGGGAALLAYGTSVGSTSGISYSGGSGMGGGNECNRGSGGSGGNGQVISYQWSTPPVTP